MEFEPIITPQEEFTNVQRLLIRTAGLQNAQVAIFKGAIPSNGNREKLALPPQSGDKSSFGVSLSTLTITFPSYFDNQGVFNDNSSLGKVTFDTVLFDVERQKNIITTPIQGRNGTIKEYIADTDWAVNIKIIISGANGEFPKNKLEDLLICLNAPVELEVESWYLLQFGINSIVATGDAYKLDEGGISYQVINIQAISDTPVELILNK